MYKKILLLTALLLSSTQIQATPGELDKAKVLLTQQLNDAVKQAGCLVDLVKDNEKLFPMKENPKDKAIIKTLAIFLDTISQMKISTGTKKTQILSTISNWKAEENTPEDIKKLTFKVTGDIQALVASVSGPFKQVAEEIYNRSSIFKKKKITKEQCGIVDNQANRVFNH